MNESWGYASEEYSHNPLSSGAYRECVTSYSYLALSCLLTVDDRIRDYRFGQLLESIVFHWYAVSVADYLAGNYPHFKVMLESDANGDDRLLRGEIMTITDIMTTRLRSKSLGSHIVAPVRQPPMVDCK